jgi:hypothetical protein
MNQRRELDAFVLGFIAASTIFGLYYNGLPSVPDAITSVAVGLGIVVAVMLAIVLATSRTVQILIAVAIATVALIWLGWGSVLWWGWWALLGGVVVWQVARLIHNTHPGRRRRHL